MIFHRLQKEKDRVDLLIKAQNSEEYGKCFSIQHEGLKFQGYFGFSADNFDEQHVNDIDIYSWTVYNTDSTMNVEKSIIGDREYFQNPNRAQDLLHKYNMKKESLRKKNNDPNDNSKAEGGEYQRDSTPNNDLDQELTDKIKRYENVDKDNVENFQRDVAGLHAETPQLVKFNMQKASNMTLSFQNIDRKVKELYNVKVLNVDQNPVPNDKVQALRDMISNLEKIGNYSIFILLVSDIDRDLQSLLATGENVASSLQEDHKNRVKVADSHINQVFDKSLGELKNDESYLPVSVTTLFFLIIIIMAGILYWKFHKAKKAHIL